MIKRRLFTGIEVEGPKRKTKTLFVGDRYIKLLEIIKALEDNRDIRRIYFGADNNPGPPYNAEEIFSFLKDHEYEIVIEIEYPKQLDFIPEKFFDRTFMRVVLALPYTYKSKSQTLYITDFKLVFKDRLKWWSVHHLKGKVTRLDDPLYKQDKTIL